MVKDDGFYNGEHSVIIGSKDTFNDWHLVPESRPVFAPPSVVTTYLDIPGADGVIDLTEAITGFPVLGTREGEWEFLVLNGYKKWYDTYSEIANYLHGKKYDVVLSDDPNYYYTARFKVNQWKSNPERESVVLNYVADPYKRAIFLSNEDWLWNPFDLQDGVILSRLCKDINLPGLPGKTTVIKLTGKMVGRMPVIPEIKFDADESVQGSRVIVAFSNKELGGDVNTKEINDGDSLIDGDIILSGYSEDNEMTFAFSGKGKINIIFRKGSL